MNEELRNEIKRSEHLLCKGLKEINDSGVMNAQTLEILYKIADIALDYSKISKYSDSYERFYDDGYGRRRRDSMGRYMDDGEYSRDNYGRDNYGRDSYQGEWQNREYLDRNLQQAANVLRDQNVR